MWACNKLSKGRYDSIKLGITAQKAAAIPSILFGSETLILTNKTIGKIESIQSKFVQILLNLPKTTTNICAQTETGLRFIRHNLYRKQ